MQYRFRMHLNANSVPIIGVFDLETSKITAENPELFGHMSVCEAKLVPIAYAGHLTFNLNVKSLPKLIPKVLIGTDSIGAFYEQMALELLYLQTTLRNNSHPIHMKPEEKASRSRVTHCGCCKRPFKSPDDIVAHHRHCQKRYNFLGFICASCNSMAVAVQCAVVVAHNLQNFESR